MQNLVWSRGQSPARLWTEDEPQWICRAIQRVARNAEATWHALRDAARRSAVAHIDETGWKVEAQLRWL